MKTVAQLKERPNFLWGMSAKTREAVAAALEGDYVDQTFDHRKNPAEPNPFKSLHGAIWREVIDKTMHMRKCMCITYLWTQVVENTAKAFRHTEHEKTFRIYHDALSQLTAKSTIKWLKETYHSDGRSYWDIWIHPERGLNANTRYQTSPPGNSPELMPLDCCLFADLVRSLRLHCLLTANLAKDDPKKFSRSTPKLLCSAIMRRTCTTGGAPTAERIVQDIGRFKPHVLAIIGSKGAAIPGIGSRNGHRRRVTGCNWGGPRVKSAKPPMPRWVHEDTRVENTKTFNESVVKAWGSVTSDLEDLCLEFKHCMTWG